MTKNKKSEPAKKIKPPRWYNNEIFEYGKELKTRGKVVAYFKIDCGRRGRATRGGGAKREVEKFVKVFENGMAVCIDTTMWKMSVTQSVGTPFKLRPSNKREFDKALKLFLQNTI
jgi:hypothetical protein